MNPLPRVSLQWPEVSTSLDDFLHYQVWRRVAGQTDAEAVRLLAGRITDRSRTFYDDYTVASGVVYEYNVTQTVEVSGEDVESDFGDWVQASVAFRQLYVHDAAAPQYYANLLVQAQQVGPVQEMAYLQPFGRGVPSARVGDVLQETYRASLGGSWTHERGEVAREQWEALMVLLARQRDASAVLCVRQAHGVRFFGVMEAPTRSDESAGQFREDVRFREVDYKEAL